VLYFSFGVKMENIAYLTNVKSSRRRVLLRRAAGTMILLCALSVGTVFGSSVTIGSDNGSNAFPFGGPFGTNTGSDYQEAYAASDFSGPMLITGIDFFLGNGFTGSLYAGTYTLSLSVISSNIGSLSSTNLAGNIGSDDTVFESVALSGKAPNTLAFSGAPFLYNPTLGNLLLDISITGGKGGSDVAFEDNEGSGTSLARYQNFGSNDGLGYGLVTEFVSASAAPAVPEPGMLSLLCCGLAAVVGTRLRRR
jgi:hypothetical protein